MRSNFAVNQNLWKRENTHTIVNGVQPILPTSPDLQQIFYYQPGKFLQALNSHPTPNTLKKLHLISYRERFSHKKDFFFLSCSLSSSLAFSLFWDEFPLLLHACIYRRGICELVVSWCNNQTYQPKTKKTCSFFDQQSPTWRLISICLHTLIDVAGLLSLLLWQANWGYTQPQLIIRHDLR